MVVPEGIPDPALIVLIGPSGSGKSTWALEHFRPQEVVSSDELRAIVGSDRSDLGASDDAFALLDQIVSARLGRGLTTIVDTLGLDPSRRQAWREAAARSSLPAIAVVFDAPANLVKQRNRERSRPVPAQVLGAQLARAATAADELAAESWTSVVRVESAASAPTSAVAAPQRRSAVAPGPDRDVPGIVLQLSRFPWREEPAAWLKAMAQAASDAGFSGIALMDHLIQIPQVDRAWEPIPDPFTTLGMLAGMDLDLRLGTLCTPITFRPAGVVAKTVATLDVLTNGRAFLGLGAGWWPREHDAFAIRFPSAASRLDELEDGIEVIRALWSKGTKGFDGRSIRLPETTCYPRPIGSPQLIVGGGGERRTLRIAAELGDACNLSSAPDVFDRKLAVFEEHRRRSGREVAVTVLDTPVIGRDRADVWARVERLRGRTPAATFAKRHHAASIDETRRRHADLFLRGVSTVFLALPDLDKPDDLLALAALNNL